VGASSGRSRMGNAALPGLDAGAASLRTSSARNSCYALLASSEPVPRWSPLPKWVGTTLPADSRPATRWHRRSERRGRVAPGKGRAGTWSASARAAPRRSRPAQPQPPMRACEAWRQTQKRSPGWQTGPAGRRASKPIERTSGPQTAGGAFSPAPTRQGGVRPKPARPGGRAIRSRRRSASRCNR
jgi:hypothetical protein